jgi:hypothetical protein
MTGRLSTTESAWIGLVIAAAITACYLALRKADSDYAGCTTTVCGEYVATSCHPEVDGPVTYSKRTSTLLPTWISRGELVMICGGACMGGPGPAGSKRCTACPPPEWTSCVGSIQR